MTTQLLLNPTLSGFSVPPRFFTEKNGSVGCIENPDHWEYTFFSLHEDDPNRIPQSLHRDRGYCIAAGWRRWEAGYVQRGVRLRAGGRYLAKAVFQPDVNFPNGDTDLTAIQWRFWIEGGGEKAFTGWTTTAKGRYKQLEEHLFVIEAARDMAVDFYFKARSIWESNVCDFNLYALTLEAVPADYGTPVIIGGAAAPVDEVTEPDNGLNPLVLSDDDLTVIAAGFRSAALSSAFSQTISDGFARFADALERHKAPIITG